MHYRLAVLLGSALWPLLVRSLGISPERNRPAGVRGRCDFDSASSPGCWGDFDLSTNYYETGPDTGVTREFWFDVVNSTMALDGVERIVLSINGTVPGPTIIADWGDDIVVHVHNTLEHNGTSLHFHGVRQNHTNAMDGVSSVTQCPVTPGETMTYRFRATQYGSSWYHSHFHLQAWNGVFGGVIINGPASAPYDEDLGTLVLSDWYHQTADELSAWASSRGPPPASNGLINGTNEYVAVDGDPRRPVGRRFETTFRPGLRYRIRLINGAMDTMFRFTIDGHWLTVVSTDFVPINPYTASSINVGIGQRYDVVVAADAAGGEASDPNAGATPSFWLRAIPASSCGTVHENGPNIKGIVHYDLGGDGGGRVQTEPNTTVWDYDDSCSDEPLSSLVPVLAMDVGQPEQTEPLAVGLKVIDGWFRWTLNGDVFTSNWRYPTLQQALEGTSSWEQTQQVIELPQPDRWVYAVIQNTGLNHPIHLHGHDVYVLAQDLGNFTSDSVLQHTNPPRRDVVMLPANGFLVLAFKTDNPGVWLMHCHIGWHTAQGFALQLVERAHEIVADAGLMGECCDNWKNYAAAKPVSADWSGVR